MNGNKTALIAGATGQTGAYLLELLLNCDVYSSVIAVVRHPFHFQHPKLEIIQVDFNDPATLAITADDVFCCLGSTMAKAKTKENFYTIDHDYPLQLAERTLYAGAKRFFLISAMGADPDSAVFYSRVKGLLEKDLKKLDFQSLVIFRPGILLGKRKEKRTGERIGKFIIQMLEPILPAKFKGVHASRLAAAILFQAKKSQPGISVINNAAILRTS